MTTLLALWEGRAAWLARLLYAGLAGLSVLIGSAWRMASAATSVASDA